MNIRRRHFLRLSALASGTTLLGAMESCAQKRAGASDTADPGNAKSIMANVKPITKEERQARIEKAQRLMAEHNMKAVILDAGTSMTYFTGLRWWPSERPMVAIIPAQGEVCYVCPGFEEGRLQELITLGKDIYVWQEDEGAFRQIAKALGDIGSNNGHVGIEERVRFFIVDGVQKEAPHLQFVSADPVTAQCRLIKSATEIALMQAATMATVEAMKMGIRKLEAGMAPADFSAVVANTHDALGAVHDFALINFAEASALPHGSMKPQVLKEGDIVLMDCGCYVEGYSSDISRTIVFGREPSKRQQQIWDLEHRAQAAGFAAANLGAPCEDVDSAARSVLTEAGFGPGYKLPGLPHRTGHGIGMDGHEWGNIVKGNRQTLQPGMCFSIEPNISIPGEFGVRLEDCVYMTQEGPKWFSLPSASVYEPFPNTAG